MEKPAVLLATPQFVSISGLSVLGTVKLLLSMVQAEVNMAQVVLIVTHAEEPGGGGKTEILEQLIKQADQVFPEPIGRAVALQFLAVAAHFFANH